MQKTLFRMLLLLMGSQMVSVADTVTTRDMSTENLVRNSSFDEGDKYWRNIDGVNYKVGINFGYNGNAGLRYHKGEDGKYVIISQELPSLKPGVTYSYGAMVRCENVTEPGAGICIEAFSKDGKWLAGGYSHKVIGNNDWKLVERTFSHGTSLNLPPDAVFRLALIIDKRASGTAYFDDIFVKEINEEWLLSQIYPTHNSISSDNGNIAFFSKLNNSKEKTTDIFLKFEVRNKKNILLVKECGIKDNYANVDLGQLPVGDYTLSISLISRNANAERVIGIRKMPLNVKDGINAKDVPSSCFFDNRGRAIVNGKPFMPIGIMTQKLGKADFERFEKAGFNCIMPYAIINSRCSNFEDIQEYFDNARRTGIKIIPSLINFSPGSCDRRNGKTASWNNISGSRNITTALINQYKNNPELLAWYINDEVSISYCKEMIEYREFVNRLDPNHPTWSVICRITEIQPMSAATDVIGIDPYPIESIDSTLMKADYFGMETEALGMPFWSVPQIFNWKVYWGTFRPGVDHDPNFQQMLAMCLLDAIHGAKGFIMFSYCSLQNPSVINSLEERWNDIVNTAKELKSLEPFIMSGKEEPPVEVKQISGVTRARCFQDSKGKCCLLIVGVDNKNEAEIILPAEFDKFISKTGAVINMGHGKYRFTGGPCSYDILAN